jgi:hypothetical protein
VESGRCSKENEFSIGTIKHSKLAAVSLSVAIIPGVLASRCWSKAGRVTSLHLCMRYARDSIVAITELVFRDISLQFQYIQHLLVPRHATCASEA